MLQEITNILTNELPSNAYINVYPYKSVFNNDYIIIAFAGSDIDINNVRGQKPQIVSLMLDVKTLNLNPQTIGGNGGSLIYRNIDKNNPKERYLAMKSVKVPFRRPKNDKDAVLRAIKRFAQNWLKTLNDNYDMLRYKDLVDYDNLLKNIK